MDPTKEELDQQIREIASSIHDKAGQLEEELGERYDSVKQTLDKTVDTVTTAVKMIAPQVLIRSHPLLAAGSALLTGFYVAHRITRKQKPMQVVMVNPHGTPIGPAQIMAAPKVERPEVRVLKTLAMTAIARFAGKEARKKLPHLSSQIQLVEDSLVGFVQARDPYSDRTPTV